MFFLNVESVVPLVDCVAEDGGATTELMRGNEVGCIGCRR